MRALLLLPLLLLPLPAFAQTATPIRLYWDANTESDLDGYELHWGTAPGVYTQTRIVPKEAVTTEVTGLTPGTRYYFALKALNTAGQRSGFSNEVSVEATSTTLTFITVPTLQSASPVP